MLAASVVTEQDAADFWNPDDLPNSTMDEYEMALRLLEQDARIARLEAALFGKALDNGR